MPLLVVNFLLMLSIPMGTLEEYSWNTIITFTLRYTVPILAIFWFGLARVPRKWRIIPVAFGTISVIVVNVFIADDFLVYAAGEHLPQNVVVAHVIQAIAFLSVLIPPNPKKIAPRPIWASMIWWIFAVVNCYLMKHIIHGFLTSAPKFTTSLIRCSNQWTVDMENHPLASLTFLWTTLTLLLASLGISWHCGRTFKALPFLSFSIMNIWVNDGLVQIHAKEVSGNIPIRGYQICVYTISLVYALQLLIPSPSPFQSSPPSPSPPPSPPPSPSSRVVNNLENGEIREENDNVVDNIVALVRRLHLTNEQTTALIEQLRS